MTTKNQIFTSVISGSPMITSEKLVGSENYLSWSASVELWFMGQGYEDHLVTQEADIPEVDRVQWKKIDAQLCSVLWQSVDPGFFFIFRPIKLVLNFGLRPKDYTRMISSVFIRWLLLLSISANRTWIYLLILVRLPLLKSSFDCDASYSLMLGLNKHSLTSSSWSLLLLASVRILRPIRDQILGSSSVPSLDDFLKLPLEEDASGTRGRGQRPHCTYCNKLGTLAIVAISYMEDLLALPIWPSPLILRCPQPPSSSASQTSQASIASVAQPGNASACLTHTSSLGPWILDSGASDHLSGIGLALPLPSLPLTLSFILLNDRSTGKTIGIGRESQGLYHLTQIHLLQFAFPLMLLSSFTIVWATLVSPSSRRWFLVFSTLSSLPCESCQLGKHTRVSFPKRLNNRGKVSF
ncbi:hypothetical protein CK203_049132 [Vitis vinifera]|uniref:Uncharacterized protein n=1 Tax=Vitis vinifera TaxID=29760 RepID=A0A438GV47_VITVI|nr:hypothetical protein CK203_049132 [Vitis vinifera]